MDGWVWVIELGEYLEVMISIVILFVIFLLVVFYYLLWDYWLGEENDCVGMFVKWDHL
jgi:hypothetical protein